MSILTARGGKGKLLSMPAKGKHHYKKRKKKHTSRAVRDLARDHKQISVEIQRAALSRQAAPRSGSTCAAHPRLGRG